MLIFYLSLIDNEDDRSKFEIIYYEYRERMYSAAFDVVKNNEDAEDAVHNAFVGIANNMESIGEAISQRTLSYVIKAAKNAAINIYNKNNKIITVEYADNIQISDDDFFNQILAKEKYSEVINSISELKDIYKFPMYYYFICDMNIKEIASLLDMSTSTVKVRIYRGKKELLKILGESNNDE